MPNSPTPFVPPGRCLPRESRRWCVPPAMLRDPADGLEGDSILAESPGDFGLLLWETVRDVRLWGETPRNARGNLFGRASADARLSLLASTAVPPQVAAPLDTLHGMLSADGRADAEIVSICCLELAAWARGAGLPHTAVACAQAGALASPEFAEAALHAGVHARGAGQDARAETWLRRAVHLARRERDHAAYCAALVELGRVYEARGNAPRAERFHRSAFRAARRCGIAAARMQAAHGLFRLALLRGDADDAARFARLALSAYEPDAPDGVGLLLEVARYAVDAGQPALARSALRRLLAAQKSLPPARLLAVRALAARARADAGSRRKGGRDARAAWGLMTDEDIPEHVRCAAAVDLAHAACIAGNLRAFRRARQAVLRFTTQDAFPAAATAMARLWPPGGPSPDQRAS